MGFRRIGEPFRPIGKPIGKSGGNQFQWNQFATFEAGAVTPYPTGADITGGVLANLNATLAAAIRGTYGLAVTTAGVGSDAFVQLSGPDNENMAIFDLLFDPNSIVMGAADNFTFITAVSSGPGAVAFVVNYRVIGGVQLFQVLCRNDAGANVAVGTFASLDQAQHLRIKWKASSAIGANDGYLHFYIDGVFRGEANFVDNDQHDIDAFNIGAIAIDAGTAGVFYLDNIRWTNQNL